MTGVEKWFLGYKPENFDMRIPDEYLKGTCFLCVKVPNEPPMPGEHDFFIGTAFVLRGPTCFPDQSIFYLITAKHVIEDTKAEGYTKLYLRMNRDDGLSTTFSLPDQWHYSSNPAIDVAVMAIPIPPGHTIYAGDINNCATDAEIKKDSIGIGDDVFAIGLFNQRWGHARNIPIMRTGIIASMPDEPFVAESGDAYNAYLIELRSIGGLSGSPVFVHLDFWRGYPEPETDLQIDLTKSEFRMRRHRYLLGVISGHWDLRRQDAATDVVAATDDEEIDRLNTGIAKVVPIQEVLNIINGKEMLELRKKAEEVHIRRTQTTKDSIKPPKQGKSEGITRPEFESILQRVSKKPSESEPKHK
jgi:hypothetical protein